MTGTPIPNETPTPTPTPAPRAKKAAKAVKGMSERDLELFPKVMQRLGSKTETPRSDAEIANDVRWLQEALGSEDKTIADLAIPRRSVKVKAALPPGLTPLDKLTADLRQAALTLGDREARFLVASYYQHQQSRIRTAHQVRQLGKIDEPNGVLDWFNGQNELFEEQIAKALDAYSASKPIGQWGRSIVGVGPIIVAGLMAHIDVTKEDDKGRVVDTAGKIWRYAGYDPTVKWLPKTKRPWNAALKRLCYILGESFVKFQNHESDSYGRIYVARKRWETYQNDDGAYSDQAIVSLQEKNFGKDTEALAWYAGCYPRGTYQRWSNIELEARDIFPDDSAKRAQWLNKSRATYLLAERLEAGQGVQMLPPGRIQLRAQRYAVKLFLSHYHHVLYTMTYLKPPPLPYVLSEGAHLKHPELATHTEFLGPPNWPMHVGHGKDAPAADAPEVLLKLPDIDPIQEMDDEPHKPDDLIR